MFPDGTPFATTAHGSNGNGESSSSNNKQQQQALFVHESYASSSPSHDPHISLASHIIRTNFGPIVQTIADCLQCRGPNGLPYSKLLYYIQKHKKRKCVFVRPTTITTTSNSEDATTGVLSDEQIRAALLVLIQHNIVSVKIQHVQHQSEVQSSAKKKKRNKQNNKQKQPLFLYRYYPERAVYMIRYGKFVEYMKEAIDETASCCIQELFYFGRLRTIDWILCSAEKAPKSEKYTTRQSVINATCKLIQAGFVQQCMPPLDNVRDPNNNEGENEEEEDMDEGEHEFEDEEDPPAKKRKVKLNLKSTSTRSDGGATTNTNIDHDNNINDNYIINDEDPAVMTLLQQNAHYKSMLPINAVWKVNIGMFHDSIRAKDLGKLVSERFGQKVQFCGSLVKAALKFRAHLEHGYNNNNNEATTTTTSNDVNNTNYETTTSLFSAQDIIKYLPKPVLQNLEKKPGGVNINLMKSWRQLSELQHPQVVRQHNDDKFEITVHQLTTYLQERIIYQVIHDRHGEVAARVISILRHKKGYLESDKLAEIAMVPAKDTREVLHHLYRSRYVDLLQLSSSSSSRQQYNNTANSLYLWGLDSHLMEKIKDNVAQALWNIRLRRQHEEEVGKIWIERAQDKADAADNGGTADENDNEHDQLNYEKFCLGLERLDAAALQLDETLMAMCDF